MKLFMWIDQEISTTSQAVAKVTELTFDKQLNEPLDLHLYDFMHRATWLNIPNKVDSEWKLTVY